MKKKNVVLWMSIILLLLSSPVYSQIKLGFQLGPNFTNSSGLRVDALYEIKSKTYLFGGILAEFKISDMFYIQPEINFLPKGVAYKLFNIPIELTFNYYEVTTNALVKINMDNFTPFLFVGPSLSFLSGAKAKEKFYYNEDPYEIDVSELFKKTDFSINFGGGIELPFSKSIDIFLMARYSLGLTNIFKEEDDAESEYKTRGTAIAVGLKFSI
jgi:hypothetical protein